MNKITNDFWDFIEKYLPDYNKRDDVLRQGELQIYVDGHESDLVNELSKDEADEELHHLLYNIYFEAIDAFTKGLGTECEHCKSQKGKFCSYCGKIIRTDQQLENPYRCSKCGSLEIQSKAWVNTNTNLYISDAAFNDEDLWCNHCESHCEQIQEEDLFKEIDEWWEYADCEIQEAVTGFDYDTYCSNPDQDKAFDDDCKDFWDKLNAEQKIIYWRHYTFEKED